MKKYIHQGDYKTVSKDVAEQLLHRLEHDESGTIIDYFQITLSDPWQEFLYYGATEIVLREYTPKNSARLVLVHVQPEALANEKAQFTPTTGLIAHVVLHRAKDVHSDILTIGDIFYNGEELSYQGANPEGCEVILLCDFYEMGSPYLKECIKMCEEMHVHRVIALPIVVWDADFVDMSDIEEDLLTNPLSRNNRPLS